MPFLTIIAYNFSKINCLALYIVPLLFLTNLIIEFISLRLSFVLFISS